MLPAFFLALLAATPALAGGPPPDQAVDARIRLERFLAAATARAGEYFDLFKDLTSEETKTVEVFRPSGEVDRRRTIVSELVVYQSQLDNASVAEYRNVIAVDGAPVADRAERVAQVLARSAKAGSTREELRRVTKDGSRFDLDHTVSGLTIAQGLPLQPWARAFFAFAVERNEEVAGRRVAVLSYQQTAPNGRFGFKLSLPSGLDGSAPLYRGRLWLDAETASLLREEREVTVVQRATGRPVVVQRAEFTYAPSPHGVPLPSRIVFVSMLNFRERPDGGVDSAPLFRITFTYKAFHRFTAEGGDVALAPADAATEAEPTSSDETPAPAVAEAPAVAAEAPEPDPSLGPEFSPDVTAEAAAAQVRARELERMARERLGDAAAATPAVTPTPRKAGDTASALPAPRTPRAAAPPQPSAAPGPTAPRAAGAGSTPPPHASDSAPEPDPSLGPEFAPDFSPEGASSAAAVRRPARPVPPPGATGGYARAPLPSASDVAVFGPRAGAPSPPPPAPRPVVPERQQEAEPATAAVAATPAPRRAVAPPRTAAAGVAPPADIATARPTLAAPDARPAALPAAPPPPRVIVTPPRASAATAALPAVAASGGMRLEPTASAPRERALPAAPPPPRVTAPPPKTITALAPVVTPGAPAATPLPAPRVAGPTQPPPAPKPSSPLPAVTPARPRRVPVVLPSPRAALAPVPPAPAAATPFAIPEVLPDASALPAAPRPVDPIKPRVGWRPPPA